MYEVVEGGENKTVWTCEKNRRKVILQNERKKERQNERDQDDNRKRDEELKLRVWKEADTIGKKIEEMEWWKDKKMDGFGEHPEQALAVRRTG